MIRATALDASFQTTFSNGEHSGVADLPVAKGGAGHGFGPHDLLEAALATCMVITARKYAQEHELPLLAARCEVQIDRSATDTVALEYILSLEGDLTLEQERALRDAVASCPVARTITRSITLRSSV